MHNFTYTLPTKVIFGEGAVLKLVPELQNAGITRVLLLTGGRSVYASGLYDKLTELLSQAGIVFESVSGVRPNPALSKVREGAAAAKKTQAQAVLAVGGGSVIDSAKFIAFGALADQDIWEIMCKKIPIAAALPVYAVVTLSGTSSEVNDTCVVTNEETNEKMPYAHSLLVPRAAVVDPVLQYSVPLSQICHCGVDCLSHALETYFDGFSTSEIIIEQSESFARAVIRCLRALPQAQHDYAVRSELAFCGTFVLSGWCSVGRARRGDFGSHRIGHALSGLFDTPHGVTLGIIMPAWMRYAYDQGVARDVLARMGTHIFGLTSAPQGDFALAAIQAFKDFVQSLGMPVCMRDLGISADQIPALVENAAATLPFGGVIAMDRERIAEVLQLAL